MDKKFRSAGAGLVYFEDTLLTTDQIVMFLNDGFEKTIELDQCYDEIKDKENIIASLEKRTIRLEEGLKEIRNAVQCQSPNWISSKANNILSK